MEEVRCLAAEEQVSNRASCGQGVVSWEVYLEEVKCPVAEEQVRNRASHRHDVVSWGVYLEKLKRMEMAGRTHVPAVEPLSSLLSA